MIIRNELCFNCNYIVSLNIDFRRLYRAMAYDFYEFKRLLLSENTLISEGSKHLGHAAAPSSPNVYTSCSRNVQRSCFGVTVTKTLRLFFQSYKKWLLASLRSYELGNYCRRLVLLLATELPAISCWGLLRGLDLLQTDLKTLLIICKLYFFVILTFIDFYGWVLIV